MSTTQYKHRNCIIELTPTTQFPELVTIIRTPKLRGDFLNRRYKTLEHAFLQLEKYESERLISAKGTYVKSQLQDVVIIPMKDMV